MFRGKGMLGVLLCWASLAQADERVIAWEYDLALQPQVQYLLRVVGLHDGRPFQEERQLQPLPRAACQQYGVPTMTPETLCARTCFAPGIYSITVSARREQQRSGESTPIVDLDLTSTDPCQKPPPDTPRSFPPVAVLPPVVAGGGVAAYLALKAREEIPALLPQLFNMGCVSWKVLAPPTPVTPCLSIEYWEPGWLVETSIRPGDTGLPPPLNTLLSGALAAAGLAQLGAGGAANANSTGQTNKHFADAHVFTLPSLGGPCTACAPSGVPALNYASELDAVAWRVGTPGLAAGPAALVLRVGFWGPLFTAAGRTGHVIHSSPVVASGLLAARAMSIAFQPVAPPPVPDAHLVTAPTLGTSTCCQLAAPRQTPCFTVGTPPFLFEHAAASLTGRYVWIFWRKQLCCVPPPGTCGITLPGIGRHEQQGCIVPF